MTSQWPIFLFFTGLCYAQQQPDDEAAVPDNFPKAFITAMAVAIVCVVVLITLVCVLAHCWQYILGPRKRSGLVSNSLVRGRWPEPVFEWPQQLGSRSRNSRKRRRRQKHRGWTRTAERPGDERSYSREGMLRG